MNCPVCGTTCADSVNYCPTCGTPLHQSTPASQSIPQQSIPQQQIPQQSTSQTYSTYVAPKTTSSSDFDYDTDSFARLSSATVPETTGADAYQSGRDSQSANPAFGSAVAMNAAIPSQQTGRSLDMTQVNKKPIWPFVVIIVLLLLIIAAVLWIFKPWDIGAEDGDTDVNDGQIVLVPNEPEDETPTYDGQIINDTPASLSDAAALEQLQDFYGQLSALDGSISSGADTFNTQYTNADTAVRQSCYSDAVDLLNSIAVNLEAVRALNIDADSAYYGQWQEICTLYEDLWHRQDVITRAWELVATNDPANVMDSVSEILSADNGADGVNIYKADYQNRYPTVSL